MRPTLAQLDAFYWIARLGSFHAASRQLRLTQPTVSARIAELEDVLGEPLFARIRQRAHLTERGHALVPLVERMLKLGDQIAAPPAGEVPLRGLLRFGTVESVALIALPVLLPKLVSRYPELTVALTLDVGSTLGAKLNARELDIAIVTDPGLAQHVAAEPVGRIELRWVANARLALPRRTIRPVDLASVPILTNPEPSSAWRMTREWFGSADVEPAHLGTCNSLTLMARLVASGYGAAILPPAILAPELKRGRIRILNTRPALEPRVMYVAVQGERTSLRPVIDLAKEAMRATGLLQPL